MIKINVLPPSNSYAVSSIAFPEVSQQAQDWVRSQLHENTALLTQAGSDFLQSSLETYRTLIDGSAIRGARALARIVGGLMHPNTIHALGSYAELRAAKPIMQRYIMACPEIRSIYQRQLCDGYSDSYFDMEPKSIGEDHYEWRQVMTGVAQEDPKQPGQYFIREYFDSPYEGDEALTAQQKFSILDTWDTVRKAILEKVDPTNIFDSDLGI